MMEIAAIVFFVTLLGVSFVIGNALAKKEQKRIESK